jgi:hypothetical protein
MSATTALWLALAWLAGAGMAWLFIAAAARLNARAERDEHEEHGP